jgi:adenylyl- and sulfurtransferase ThiI
MIRIKVTAKLKEPGVGQSMSLIAVNGHEIVAELPCNKLDRTNAITTRMMMMNVANYHSILCPERIFHSLSDSL